MNDGDRDREQNSEAAEENLDRKGRNEDQQRREPHPMSEEAWV